MISVRPGVCSYVVYAVYQGASKVHLFTTDCMIIMIIVTKIIVIITTMTMVIITMLSMLVLRVIMEVIIVIMVCIGFVEVFHRRDSWKPSS